MGALQDREKRLERRLRFHIESVEYLGGLHDPVITVEFRGGEIRVLRGEPLLALWRLCLRLAKRIEELEADLVEWRECIQRTERANHDLAIAQEENAMLLDNIAQWRSEDRLPPVTPADLTLEQRDALIEAVRRV